MADDRPYWKDEGWPAQVQENARIRGDQWEHDFAHIAEAFMERFDMGRTDALLVMVFYENVLIKQRMSTLLSVYEETAKRLEALIPKQERVLDAAVEELDTLQDGEKWKED